MKKKYWMIGSIALITIILVCVFYFFVFRTKIVFENEQTVIEYGSEFKYENCIKKTIPEKLKVEYPTLEIKEVGQYKVEFHYGKNKLNHKIKHMIIVKDTIKPKILLNHKKEIEIHKNDSYDVLSNIKEVTNIDEKALSNIQIYSNEKYENTLKKLKKENKKIHNRKITKQKDIIKSDMNGNMIMVTTNLNTNELGSYEVQAAAIDNNFNVTEIKWKIKVVEENSVLNTGGNIVCKYPIDTIPETEAIISDYQEQFTYDENEMITSASFITTMRFKEGYDQDSNIKILNTSLHDEYEKYNDIEGVNISINQSGSVITTTIYIDFVKYDSKSDPIGIITDKKIGKIDVKETLNNMKKRKIDCVVD